MWPVFDEEIRNLGESQALVASISPSDGTWKLNRKSRPSKSYIQFKTKTLRDQCHQTIVSSQSCFAVLSSQSSERLPVSFGAAKRRRYLVGGEHFSLKNNGVYRAGLLEVLNIDVSRDFFDLFYKHLFIITTGPTSLRFPYNLIAFNHFDGYLVQRVSIFSALGLLWWCQACWLNLISFLVLTGMSQMIVRVSLSFPVICPPLWCCTLCRYSRGYKKRSCRVKKCTRTFLIQGNHLSCDQWFLCSGVKVCTLGSYIIITVKTFWMPKVRQ